MAGLPEAMALKQAKADIKQYSIDHEPNRWADGHMLLSDQYLSDAFGFPGPARAADKAIEHLKEALQVVTLENDFMKFLAVQLRLARVYPKRVAGNRTENLTKALAAAKTALRISKHRPSCPPSFVAQVYANIGSIYADVDFGSNDARGANEDLAIRHYLAALERSSMDDDNESWADRQMKVGRIYFARKNGKRRSNLKVAIKHLVEALKVYTKSKNRWDWAETHECLAASYGALRNTADRAASLAIMSEEEFAEEQSALLEKSISSCTNALELYTPTYGPASW
jgi:tetratricopeptide (TPR) repeat protein